MDGGDHEDMKKIITGFTLCAMLFALCLPAEGQQAKKVARIGLVTQGSGTDAVSYRADSLRQGLGEVGWIEGRDFIIEHRRTEGKAERSLTIASEMVRLRLMSWFGAAGRKVRKR